MKATVVDLKQSRQHPLLGQSDIRDLQSVIAQLIGEPFLFARLGYADELTLHFGTPRLAKHPRLRAKGVRYGSYLLGLCGSGWLIKSIPKDRLIIDDSQLELDPSLSNLDEQAVRSVFAEGELFRADTPVIAAKPFELKKAAGIALRLETADGSGIVILPAPAGHDDDELDHDSLPDWELKTPDGLLRVGSGLQWEWKSLPDEG